MVFYRGCCNRKEVSMKKFVMVMLSIGIGGGMALADTVNFDTFKIGEPPPGWIATKTGTGPAKWSVEKDDTAPSKPNVLKQSGQATYPVCIKEDTNLKDGFVEVKFKPVSGKEDQAGGLIWRARDSNNYYVARANALEDNVTIYDTVNGRRTERKRTRVKVASNQWHTLRTGTQSAIRSVDSVRTPACSGSGIRSAALNRPGWEIDV